MLEMSKGQSLDLHKEAGKTLTKIRLGAGWDVLEGKTADLDLWLLAKGQKPLYFNNMSIPGATLDGDDRTGAGSKDGADENIAIDVSALTAEEYTVVVNIYDAVKKGQMFSDVKRAFVEVEDTETKTKVFNYNISENGGSNSTLVVGKLVKKNGGLEFHATSEFSSKDMETVAKECGSIV